MVVVFYFGKWVFLIDKNSDDNRMKMIKRIMFLQTNLAQTDSGSEVACHYIIQFQCGRR